MSPLHRTSVALVAACIGLAASSLATAAPASANASGNASSAPAARQRASAPRASAPHRAPSGVHAHGDHPQAMCGDRMKHGHPASMPMGGHDAASAAAMEMGAPCMSAPASAP